MKTIWMFLSLIAVFPVLSVADAPNPIVGDFEYAGQFTVERFERAELVEGNSSAAERRVRELINSGHVCSSEPSGRMCIKPLSWEGAREWITGRVNNHLVGWLLRTHTPIGEMELVYESESEIIWTVLQKAVLPGAATYHADYMWSDGSWTLHLRHKRGPAISTFLVTDSGIRAPLVFERPDGTGQERVYLTADLQQLVR